MNKQTKDQATAFLNGYLALPLIMLAVLALVNTGVYFVNANAGILMSGGLILYLIIVLIWYGTKRQAVFGDMITFAAGYGQVQKQLLKDLAIPYAVIDEFGRLLWFNSPFEALVDKDASQYHRSVTALFPELTKERFPDVDEETDIRLSFQERDYRVHMRYIRIESITNTPLPETEAHGEEENPEGDCLYAAFWFDETELHYFKQKYEDETMVAGLLYLDNYDEALESVEDVRRSLMTALIDRKIGKYFSELDCLVQKYEKDKFMIVMRNRALTEMRDTKFAILEEVKTVNIGNDMAMTISMGVGANSGSFEKNAEYARTAIDLALGRGGDQVVLKSGESVAYFGGKTQAVEKSTRVKARVKAQALREFMETKEDIIVMGHRIIDVDAFGAAIGICRAAKTLNKKASIVIDTPTSSIRPMMDEFLHNPDYDPDMFVTCEKALASVTDQTMLVVVDTHQPSYTECEELLYRVKTIVVLDHHRRSKEVISNTVLSYIEPYASSACEMVAEILQYFDEKMRLRNIEADAIYAGIMVDTDNFLQKTGVRTFEAAAYLRRCGADVTRVRKLFREELADYRAKGAAIRNTELFLDHFAISECPPDQVDSPTIVAAQAANELLNVIGVKASFVLTLYRGRIYISARAIDEVNVQVIMERMGGGGHMNIAGCQLDDMTVAGAKAYLKEVLSEMLEGGEI